MPFVILVGAVLVAGLVAVLLLHMVAAQDGFRATALSQRLATLTNQEQDLQQKVDADSAPQALQKSAAGLGMVPASVGSYRRLHDGRAIGTQTGVSVPPPAPPAAKTTTTKTVTAKTATSTTATTTGKSTKATATTTTTTGTAGATGTTGKAGTTPKPGTTGTPKPGTTGTTSKTPKAGKTGGGAGKPPTHHTAGR
ncbi:MAG TPA: hypothetical protein VHV79_11405 [Mycobacteriales bacterium]|nr:hypothetical protein [Mycobacteriales bacterium]